MQNVLEALRQVLARPLGWLDLAAAVTIGICVCAMFMAILVNFVEGSRHTTVKQRRRSVVATGTMAVFFLVLYLLIRFRVWGVPADNAAVRVVCSIAGLALILVGCIVNIAGRFKLGRNWADHVTLYEDQTLVRSGVYRWVRHPLYASLMWMFYGASLVYLNVAAFLATTLIFIPFMAYRARLEEGLLAKEFPEYDEYRRKVGMFFPQWKG